MPEQHVRQQLDDRDVQTARAQRFGHLQSDQPAADDHGLLDVSGGQRIADGRRVAELAQAEDVIQAGALDGRHDGPTAHGQDQLVVRQRLPGARVELDDLHGLGGAIDARGARIEQGADALDRTEEVGVTRHADGSRREVAQLGDLALDVVGQPAAGVREYAALLDDGDLSLGVQPACPGGRFAATCHTADDNDLARIAHGAYLPSACPCSWPSASMLGHNLTECHRFAACRLQNLDAGCPPGGKHLRQQLTRCPY